jgi:hypothetical protein
VFLLDETVSPTKHIFCYITHIFSDKGKPVERQGRKAMGLKMSGDIHDRQAAEEMFKYKWIFLVGLV